MGRLVDIDDVIPVISNHHFDEDKNDFDLLIHNLCKEVKKIPTAYDVSKVMAELEVMEEKRVRFAKQILDYWDKQGTQQTILFLKDIVENSEVHK